MFAEFFQGLSLRGKQSVDYLFPYVWPSEIYFKIISNLLLSDKIEDSESEYFPSL